MSKWIKSATEDRKYDLSGRVEIFIDPSDIEFNNKAHDIMYDTALPREEKLSKLQAMEEEIIRDIASGKIIEASRLGIEITVELGTPEYKVDWEKIMGEEI